MPIPAFLPLVLLCAPGQAQWRLAVDERFVASPRYLHGAHTPSLTVDDQGAPWVGFVRHNAQKTHQATVGTRTSSGWKFEEKLHAKASATLVKWHAGELRVVVALLTKESVTIGAKNSEKEHDFIARRLAKDGALLGTYKGLFARKGASLQTIDIRDDNSVDNACILDEGVVARFQDRRGWLGYFLFGWDGSRRAVLETSEHHSCWAQGSTVLFQLRGGGRHPSGSPILMRGGDAPEKLTTSSSPKPCSKASECQGSYTLFRTLGLGRGGANALPVLVRYRFGAAWRPNCTKYQTREIQGSTMPPCEKLSETLYPSLDRKKRESHALFIQREAFEVDWFSPSSEAAMTMDHLGRVHIALYEDPQKSPTQLRYFRLDPRRASDW